MINLVTGATGHIGNVLVRKLIEKGKQVRALVLPGEDCRPIEDLDVDKVTGDITQSSTMINLFQDVDTVYHLAGAISIMPGKNQLLWQINYQGTLNMIQASLNARVKRFIYASSIHAISRVPHGVIIDETIPFDPNNPYGEYDRSKALASIEVLKSIEQGLDAVLVLPTGVIGPYDFRRSEMGQLILDYLENKPQLFVDGAYDFVDVRDVAEGFIQAAEVGHPGERYILSGEQITVEKLVKSFQQIGGNRLFTLRIPRSLARFAAIFTPIYYRLANVKPKFTPYSLEVLNSNSIISCAKAARELGYHARPLLVTLQDTLDWFDKNRNRLCPSISR